MVSGELGLLVIVSLEETQIDDQISVGGRIIFFQDIPIVWCLRAMRNTTLSSAEVEIHMIFIWV